MFTARFELSFKMHHLSLSESPHPPGISRERLRNRGHNKRDTVLIQGLVTLLAVLSSFPVSHDRLSYQ